MSAPATPSLDQIVKGAPPPNISLNQVALSPSHSLSSRLSPPENDHQQQIRPPHMPSDPTSLLPSSPPQIYLNLLILEASLRAQYLTLRARKRQNTFVLLMLMLWLGYFAYLLWLRPRDDGKGVGGSQYWLLDMTQKLCLITGLVFSVLFWATGQFDRGLWWPRRWIGVTNRGLRGFNCKIVVMRGPWHAELWGLLKFLFPFSGGLWGGTGDEAAGSSYHFIHLGHHEKKEPVTSELGSRPRHRILREDGKEWMEEDVAPGGDYVKLLLLPKPFSPDFRENWELYRTEFWGRENERRAELRKRVRVRQREIAEEEGGWLWWTGWRGWPWKKAKPGRSRSDMEKMASLTRPHSSHGQPASGAAKERKRRSSMLMKERGRDTGADLSRNSSRDTTPSNDMDRRPETRERRLSTSTTGSAGTPTERRSSRRKAPGSAASVSGAGPAQRPGPRAKFPSSGSLSGAPKRGSTLSRSESVNEGDAEEDEGGKGGDVFPNAPSA